MISLHPAQCLCLVVESEAGGGAAGGTADGAHDAGEQFDCCCKIHLRPHHHGNYIDCGVVRGPEGCSRVPAALASMIPQHRYHSEPRVEPATRQGWPEAER